MSPLTDMAWSDVEQATLRLPAGTSADISAASEVLYRSLHKTPPDGRIIRDVAYGSHPRQRLDLHPASDGSAGVPVLLFVHGGGFVRGDKSQPDLFYYDNIGNWATRSGLLGATMSYRLAPEHAWPSGAQDVAAAIAWLQAHAKEHGGDPDRIYLMGHSGGAAHAADHVVGHGRSASTPHGLAGCILLSGVYDLVLGPASPNYYGSDPSKYGACSTAAGLASAQVPLFMAVAQADPPVLHKQLVATLQAFMNQDRPLPHVAHAIGHNHYTIVHHLNTPDRRLSEQILQFIARTAR